MMFPPLKGQSLLRHCTTEVHDNHCYDIVPTEVSGTYAVIGEPYSQTRKTVDT